MIQQNTSPLTKVQNAKLLQASLGIIQKMVSYGFTFFSSVVTSTRVDDLNVEHEGPAYSDCLFFHLEGHALIVKIELRAYSNHLGNFLQYVNAAVVLEASYLSTPYLDTYQRAYEYAVARSYTRLAREAHYADSFEVPDFPFIERRADLKGWHTKGRGTYGSYTTDLVAKYTGIEVIETLAESLIKLKPVLLSADNGRIEEVHKSFFLPTNFSSEIPEQEIWDNINTRVIRQLVAKVI